MVKYVFCVMLSFYACLSFGGDDFDELIFGVVHNDAKKVKEQLEKVKRDDVLKCNIYGLSPLELAYNNESFELVLLILNYLPKEYVVSFFESKVNYIYKRFLIFAIRYADKDILMLILSQECRYDDEGIFVAIVERNDVSILDEFLCLDVGGQWMWIMSNAAASKGLNEIISELIMLGGDMCGHIYKEEESCFYLALKNKHYESLELMLKPMNENKRDECLKMLIVVSAKKNNLEALSWLLDNGADPNGMYWFEIPLEVGVNSGNVEVVKMLIKYGADVNEILSYIPYLTRAAKDGKLNIMKLLINAGAVVDIEDGDSPLQEASEMGMLESVKLLIHSGANVNHIGKGDKSALMVAAEKGHLEIVKILLANGADINEGENRGALNFSIASGNVEVAEYLIKNGADVNYSYYFTPLELATKRRMTGIAALLKEYGAK